MSYIIDVYKEKVPAQKNFICFATYVSMFPQLVAGPIVRYRDVCNEIMHRKETFKMFSDGVCCFIRGLAKKVLVANNIGLLWTTIKALPSAEVSVVTAWLGIIAFTFQIYFDFSGYSDMAIGLGKMLGFNINPNFNFPYISKSITEFWRRWHISLGSWFKEYVYIPLGGNRTTKIKNYRNLIIVWFLTGFWHGANWNFIMWGMYFGVIIIAEKKFLLKWLESKPAFISHFYSIILIIIGWVIFEFESIPGMVQFFKAMSGIGASSLIDSRALYYLYTNVLLLLVAGVFSTPLPSKIAAVLKKKFEAVNFLLIPAGYSAIVVICVAYLVNQSYNPFLYFRF
jgi:alginate O-acetyltransferase complex protein AlgI